MKKTKKDIIMTQKDAEDYRDNNICRFCETIIESDKVRNHCHLTGKHIGPGHSKGNINVIEDKSNFIPFIFHKFSNYVCHLFFKNIVDKKNDELNFKNIPTTNEEYIYRKIWLY